MIGKEIKYSSLPPEAAKLLEERLSGTRTIPFEDMPDSMLEGKISDGIYTLIPIPDDVPREAYDSLPDYRDLDDESFDAIDRIVEIAEQREIVKSNRREERKRLNDYGSSPDIYVN